MNKLSTRGMRVAFLPETGKNLTEESLSKDFPLSGDEAKNIYEQIVSGPSEAEVISKVPCRRLLESKKKKGKRKMKPRSLSELSSSTSGADLFFYVQNNQVALLREALSNDIKAIDARDSYQWSLLMVASYGGHDAVVELLLGLGAPWRGVEDKKGRNAIDLARVAGHHELASFIESHDETKQYEYYEDTHFHRKRRRQHIPDGTRVRKKACFRCDCCDVSVAESSKATHDTSTVHLFNCQHRSHRADLSYGIGESNKGYQMLVQSGWDPQKGLGPTQQGKMFPVKTILKQDRIGLGGSEGKARITHFQPHDEDAVKTNRDKYKKHGPIKRKKDLVKDQIKDRQWEIRTRAMLNQE